MSEPLAIVAATSGLLELASIVSRATAPKQRDGGAHEQQQQPQQNKQQQQRSKGINWHYHAWSALRRFRSYASLFAAHVIAGKLWRIIVAALWPQTWRKQYRSSAFLVAAAVSCAVQYGVGALPPVLPIMLAASAVIRSPWGRKVPMLVWWWVAATGMSYQLWTKYHLMPSRWQSLLAHGSGLRRAAIEYRSRTLTIVPCDDPQYGCHPGESSCVRAALRDARNGLPQVAILYAITHALSSILGGRPPSAVSYVRCVASLWLQMIGGRSAFCLQSRLFPDRHQPWLGTLVGWVASNLSLVGTVESRRDLAVFNAGQVAYTFAAPGVQRRALGAAALAVASGLSVFGVTAVSGGRLSGGSRMLAAVNFGWQV